MYVNKYTVTHTQVYIHTHTFLYTRVRSFKSPALFWEVKLKESKALATEKAPRPTVHQLIHACDILEQVCIYIYIYIYIHHVCVCM